MPGRMASKECLVLVKISLTKDTSLCLKATLLTQNIYHSPITAGSTQQAINDTIPPACKQAIRLSAFVHLCYCRVHLPIVCSWCPGYSSRQRDFKHQTESPLRLSGHTPHRCGEGSATGAMHSLGLEGSVTENCNVSNQTSQIDLNSKSLSIDIYIYICV